MNFTIRDARIEDMEQVLSLIQELAIFEKEPNAVVITVEDLKQYGYGSQPAFHCFVAEVAGEVWHWYIQGFRHGKERPFILKI